MSGVVWHYVFKFVITGDAAVGKSSLLVQLTDQRFLANLEPTLGVEFGSKLITLPDDDTVVKLQCWDTAGQESFRSITRSYYRGAAGCLLVYDVTSRKSFLNARSWLAEVREHADPHVSCILVGNKVDLCEDPTTSSAADTSLTSPPHAASLQIRSVTEKKNTASRAMTKSKLREVPHAEAEQWAKEEGMLFVEASAKSGLNVEQAFIDASYDIMAKIKQGVFDDHQISGANPSVNLISDRTATSSCCAS